MTTFGCGCRGTVHDVGCWTQRQANNVMTPSVIIGGIAPPPLRDFGPCVKCGGDNIGVSYHDAKPHCRNCPPPPPSCKYNDCGRKDEHLMVWCFRCQYRWLEDVSK